MWCPGHIAINLGRQILSSLSAVRHRIERRPEILRQLRDTGLTFISAADLLGHKLPSVRRLAKKERAICSSCGAATVHSPSPPTPRVDTISPTPSMIRRATERWEPPPWPRGLVAPPPPLSGAIHAFSIPSNIATDVISKLDISALFSGSQLGAMFMGIAKTCETIFAELGRIVSVLRSVVGHASSAPTVKQEDGQVNSATSTQHARRCPSCNRVVPRGKFCTGCGLRLT